MPHIIKIQDCRAGDVVLCLGAGSVGKMITHETDSAYTHAAICLDGARFAESTKDEGVRIVEGSELISRYERLVVFRQPHVWSARRLTKLQEFITECKASGARYNLMGALRLPKRYEEHQITLRQKLELYFRGDLSPTLLTERKQLYFCSELVVYCFLVTGIIAPSAAVLYQPDTMTPGALGNDATFGTFCGYIASATSSAIPEDDEFYHSVPFHEVFGTQA